MDLIVNSLYSSKEIFLRELVSNASDALDKVRFESLTSSDEVGDTSNIEIKIKCDAEAKTLVIEDNGIGMTKDELVDSLGTIARSGTAKFMEALKEKNEDSNLIGQFGVGFYSSFLVADKVTVASKSYKEDGTWQWESEMGTSSYTVREAEDPLERGTRITLYLKEEAEEFSNPSRITSLVKTYSEFISFPIKVWSSQSVPRQVIDEEATKKAKEEAAAKAEEGAEPEEVADVMKTEYDEVWDWRTQNDSAPIWVRSTKDVTKEEYATFYKSAFKEFMDPATQTHFSVEGDIEFKSILFVPGMAPFEQQDMMRPKNIKLYVKRVFISDEFDDDLMPRYLSFIKGVVDCADLPLNVSREILQESRTVRIMRKRLVRKSLDMLADLAKAEDKEPYDQFFQNFGRNLKLGIIEDEPNRKALAKLLRFNTSKRDATSLEDYVAGMPESQTAIYYLAAGSKDAALNAPFMEGFKKRDLEVIFLTEPIDEVAITNLGKFSDKDLVDITKEDVDFGDDAEKEEEEAREKEFEGLTTWMKETLGEKVEKVVLSKRLGDSPCMLVTSKFGWSANMERIMTAQAMGDSKSLEYMKGRKIMEINPDSPIIQSLKDKCSAPDDQSTQICTLLFDTALLTSGFIVEEPSEFASRIFTLMNTAAGAESKISGEGADGVVEPEVLGKDDDAWA